MDPSHPTRIGLVSRAAILDLGIAESPLMLSVLQRWGRDFGKSLLGVSIILGLVSATFSFFQVVVVFLPLGVLIIGFVSRNVRLAIASAVVAYIAHLFAANIRGLLFAQQFPYQFLLFPGLLFLAVFAAISAGGYYSKLFQFRSKQWLGVALLALLMVSSFALLPAGNSILGAPSSTISFTLEIVANQSSTPGLAIITPAPLLRGSDYPAIFSHPDPGLFSDYQSSIVNTSYGPGLLLNISSLPEKVVVPASNTVIDPLISEPWYGPGSVLYRGTLQFSIPMPYPLDIGRPTLELSKNSTSHDYFGPCVPPLIDYYYVLGGPVWISVLNAGPGSGVKIRISADNANRRMVDPYSGIIDSSGFSEWMQTGTTRTGWAAAQGFSSCGNRLIYPTTA